MRTCSLLLCGWVTLVACGGGPTDGPEYPKAPPKAAEPIVIKEERPPAGAIWRDELIDSLNAGLGAFLQHLEVEASLEEGRFRGFRVLQLVPPGYWEGIDLEPGDVVVSVNGMPIERETEAYAAFEALRSAKEIRIVTLRSGAPREVAVGIIERAGVSPAHVGAAGSSTSLTTAAPGSAVGGAGGSASFSPAGSAGLVGGARNASDGSGTSAAGKRSK